MILNFTDPFFTTRVLGFEPLFDRLQRLSESNERSSSYPPYNISKDGNLFAIEIAVAGLSKEDIQIELADGVLTISYDGQILKLSMVKTRLCIKELLKELLNNNSLYLKMWLFKVQS